MIWSRFEYFPWHEYRVGVSTVCNLETIVGVREVRWRVRVIGIKIIQTSRR